MTEASEEFYKCRVGTVLYDHRRKRQYLIINLEHQGWPYLTFFYMSSKGYPRCYSIFVGAFLKEDIKIEKL